MLLDRLGQSDATARYTLKSCPQMAFERTRLVDGKQTFPQALGSLLTLSLVFKALGTASVLNNVNHIHQINPMNLESFNAASVLSKFQRTDLIPYSCCCMIQNFGYCSQERTNGNGILQVHAIFYLHRATSDSKRIYFHITYHLPAPLEENDPENAS